ncbi:MAG: threonine synthase [Planctomycetes bacterium]|nr:threonine synthase [Planctomycetota bacterium]
MNAAAFLRCIRPACHATFDLTAPIFACGRCGSLLDVAYDWDRLSVPASLSFFQERHATRNEPIDFSGVWRFREILPFAPPSDLVTVGEGQTLLQAPDIRRLDLPLKPGHLHFQYEGLNPSGSFKDNGMAAAFTMARILGRRRVGCASTGNTSASLAMYASLTQLNDGTPMRGIVFIGSGKIAHGKLSQALDFGALTLQIDGDFDACLKRIREAADRLNLYLMNSVNPFRLEGQKTIMYRVLENLDWGPPDWIVVPGGNLGNASAFGKAFIELHALGLIRRIPRLAVINASGANTLHELVNNRGLRWSNGAWDDAIIAGHRNERATAGLRAQTVASAIEIADPVNLPKALRSLDAMNGLVTDVTDGAILDEKARIGRTGLGCEPASAASLAGLRKLLVNGQIANDARVVCILTGHALKDPDATVRYHMNAEPSPPRESSAPRAQFANNPIRVADDLDAICRVIEQQDIAR